MRCSVDALRKKVLEVYELAKTMHEEGFSKLARIRAELSKSPDLEQVVDVIAVLKKVEACLKDSKVETGKAITQLSKAACMLYLQQGMIGDTIRTEWVTANPDSKSVPKVPKQSEDPDTYAKLAEYFGVAVDAPFRPHWPSMVEYCTAQEANLKPLPPGINPKDLSVEYTVVCRFHKDADVDELLQRSKEEPSYGKV
jgi:hypothetical protein